MKVETGISGDKYLVFASEDDAAAYNEWLASIGIESLKFACFGGLFNALQLTSIDCTAEYIVFA